MELVLLLYAAAVADNVRGLLSGGATVAFLLMLISFAATAYSAQKVLNDFDEDTLQSPDAMGLKRFNRLTRKCTTVLFFSWVALTLTSRLVPTRNDVYVLAGGYVALKVVNDPVVKDLGNKALRSIDTWLDKEFPTTLDAARSQVEKSVTPVTEEAK